MSSRPPVEIAASAHDDLADIWNYIAGHSEANADKLIKRILGMCARLGRWPGWGRPAPELGSRLRCYGVARFVIVYRVETDRILIVHVFNGARDLPSSMRVE